VAVFVELCECLGQNVGASGFAHTCRSYEHVAVPDLRGLEKLDDLRDEGWNNLQLVLAQLSLNLLLKKSIVDIRHIDTREKILDDSREKWQIDLQELGHIRVTHGPDEQDVLRYGIVFTFELSSHDEDRFNGSHTEVVVVLLRELLRCQTVELHHFLG
jgi:hypothetical protein